MTISNLILYTRAKLTRLLSEHKRLDTHSNSAIINDTITLNFFLDLKLTQLILMVMAIIIPVTYIAL